MNKKKRNRIKLHREQKQAVHEKRRKEKRRLARLSTKIVNLADKHAEEERIKKREEADEFSKTS